MLRGDRDRDRETRRRSLQIAAVILLPVVAAMAWQYRPLNSTERLLVGRWRAPTEDLDWSYPTSMPGGHLEVIHFTADRRYWYRGDFLAPIEAGSWRVAGSSLCLDQDEVGPWSYDRLIVVAKKLFGQFPRRRLYHLILASPPVAFHMESPLHSVYWTQDTDSRDVPLVDELSPSDAPAPVGSPTR